MNRGGGYTIVETLIFLVVTGALFISAVSLMSGRQANVQFSQAVTDAQSRLQDIIGQVSTGYVPANTSATCVVSVADANSAPAFDNNIPSQQGTSNDCVFLGKAVVFNEGDDGGKASIITLAARRLNSAGREVASLDEANPVPIAKRTAADTNPDVTENFIFNYGIHITRITSVSGERFGTMLFLSTLPKYQSSTGTLASGAQRVSFAGLKGSLASDDIYTSTQKLVTFDESDVTMNPQGGIIVCLADGPDPLSAKRKAMLTIGEGAAQTAVTLDVGNYNQDLCER